MRVSSPWSRRGGFTLIELLVVIVVIALLIGILVPAVQKVRASGERSVCSNNLKQVALGFHLHHEQFGHLPFSQRTPGQDGPVKRHGVLTSILPFIEQKSLYDRYDFADDWFGNTASQNRAVASARISTFLCPSSPQTVTTIPSAGGVPITHERLDGKPDAGEWESVSPTGWTGVTDYAPLTHVGPQLVDWYNSNQASTTAPSGSLASLTTGTVSGGVGILAKNTKSTFAQVRDGLGQTILLAESAGRPLLFRKGRQIGNFPTDRVNGGGWSRNANDISLEGFTADGASSPGPIGINAANGEPGGSATYQGSKYQTNGTGAPYSFHVGGANFAFGDGSVHFLSEKTDIGVLIRLTTRDAGDVVDTGAIGL